MTAVEWLFIELYEKFEMKGDGREMNKVLEQAKAMEKEQMIKFANECLKNYLSVRGYKTPEQYYNETYKNK